MTKLLEKQIEKKCCALAKNQAVLQYKFTSPGSSGVPDRLFIFPGGEVVFVEFKRPGGIATKLQLAQMRRIMNQGTACYVVDNVEAFEDILDTHLHV